MNPTNPLESVYFISLPENFDLNSATFQIDKSIPLYENENENENEMDVRQ